MMILPEIRSLLAAEAEIRLSETPEGKPLIRGVALRYGSLSAVLKDPQGRPFRERFTAGAFSRALATGADVRCLVNHDRNIVLGRTKNGTLRLMDDGDALRFECEPSDSPIDQHYARKIERGDMDGMSFRFYKKAERWSGMGEATVRDIDEADIDDVSIVTYPAYRDTEAVLRSLDEHGRSQSRQASRRVLARMRLRLAEADD